MLSTVVSASPTSSSSSSTSSSIEHVCPGCKAARRANATKATAAMVNNTGSRRDPAACLPFSPHTNLNVADCLRLVDQLLGDTKGCTSNQAEPHTNSDVKDCGIDNPDAHPSHYAARPQAALFCVQQPDDLVSPPATTTTAAAVATAAATTVIVALPEEIGLKVLSYLGPGGIISARAVCKGWRRFVDCHEDRVWATVAALRYPALFQAHLSGPSPSLRAPLGALAGAPTQATRKRLCDREQLTRLLKGGVGTQGRSLKDKVLREYRAEQGWRSGSPVFLQGAGSETASPRVLMCRLDSSGWGDAMQSMGL
eukprot:m.487471 g.487471  ORF g.487471 m.487471 type:complete len:311 (+) comp25038_c0_seq1:318-1250(+)